MNFDAALLEWLPNSSSDCSRYFEGFCFRVGSRLRNRQSSLFYKIIREFDRVLGLVPYSGKNKLSIDI